MSAFDDPDRSPEEVWIRAFPTVGKMLDGRWEVFAACQTCDLKATVSLALVARLSGPNFRLWGTSRKCVRRGCPGRMHLRGKPPKGGVWLDLTRARERS